MEPKGLYLVRRIGPGSFVKFYGPFDDRDLADSVAIRAIEKHVGSKVIVEPLDEFDDHRKRCSSRRSSPATSTS